MVSADVREDGGRDQLLKQNHYKWQEGPSWVVFIMVFVNLSIGILSLIFGNEYQVFFRFLMVFCIFI